MITAREDVSSFAALADERTQILEYLVGHMHETLGQTAGFLAETTDYVLSAPGKLLRPLLLIDACKAAGGDPSLVFPAAAGTEYGHIASLIHDDIIDGDAQRRGQDTLHIKYNVPAALLTGDYLIFHTFLCYTQCADSGVSAERVLKAIRMLSTTCIEMCQGQALESQVSGNLDTDERTYLELIRLKTATFCQSAAAIGACLGGADDDVVDALSTYGTNLGMAFQIMDDILSYDGSSFLMGKPLTSDIRNQRVTLPIIYALESDDASTRVRLERLFAADPDTGLDTHSAVVHLLLTTRALDRARALAYRYTHKAKAQLDRLPYTDSRERLRSLADIFLTRVH
ncbi:MAG: polyprenyl synthetase family protein [Ktedonobacterales bacterium]